MKLDMTLDITSSSTAADWVRQSRIKEKESKINLKKAAELKQKQLEEEEDELLNQSKSMYSSSDLRGLKVMHSASDFVEGQDVILTLADSNILDKDDDGKVIGINEEGAVLENVQLADKDRRLDRENKKRKLNQPVYSALDDYEFQDGVATGNRAPLLPQYEKEKKVVPKFELGEDGGLSFNTASSKPQIQHVDGCKEIHSLQTSIKEVNDYYTAAEFTKFSKAKKGSEKRKKSTRKKDLDDETSESNNDSGNIDNIIAQSSSTGMDVTTEHIKKLKTAVSLISTYKAPPVPFHSIDLDEDDPDMVQSLARARRMALLKKQSEEEESVHTTGMNIDHTSSTANEENGEKSTKNGHIFSSSYLPTTVSNNSTYSHSITANTGGVNNSNGNLEEDDDIDTDGRRADGTLVFNSTTEFATRLQARLTEKARNKAEAVMKELERTSALAAERSSTVNNNTSSSSSNKSEHMSTHGTGGVSRTKRSSFVTISNEEEDSSDTIDNNNSNVSAIDAILSSIEGNSNNNNAVTIRSFEQNGGGGGEGDNDISDMEVDDDSEDEEITSQQISNESKGDSNGDEQMAFLHRQPLVAKGMAATLSLLQGTGELRKTEELAGRAKDSRAYDPSSTDMGVKLEYRDEYGRKLTQKEAFRQLSYRFHGYGPSQKKKEKRLKALELQNKASSSARAGSSLFDATTGGANSSNSSGNMMRSLTKAQEATGKAHITIQGGGLAHAAIPASSLSAAAVNKEKERIRKKNEATAGLSK